MSAHLLGVPAVLLFGTLAFMITRSRRVSYIDVWVFVLFGFYLGGTGVGTFLSAMVNAAFHVFGGSS